MVQASRLRFVVVQAGRPHHNARLFKLLMRDYLVIVAGLFSGRTGCRAISARCCWAMSAGTVPPSMVSSLAATVSFGMAFNAARNSDWAGPLCPSIAYWTPRRNRPSGAEGVLTVNFSKARSWVV